MNTNLPHFLNPRALLQLARVPWQLCVDAVEECWVGDISRRCDRCAEVGGTLASCGVDSASFNAMPLFS